MRVAAVFAVLILGCVGCGPGPSAGPGEASVVRLLPLAKEATVEWPAGLEGPVPEGVTGVKNYRQVRHRRLGRVAMFPESGGEERLALLARVGSTYSFDVIVQPRAVLRLGTGYAPPEAAAEGELSFVVAAEVAETGESVSILEQTVPFDARGGWRDVELGLGELAGRRVRLELTVEGSDFSAPPIGAWSAPEIMVPAAPEEGWDVVLLVLDTLRADRLGSYGNPRGLTPNLDELAEGGVLFASAVSQSPWTRPSHQSMFSGLYPTTKGLSKEPVLAELLRESGFRTEALTAGGQMDFRMGFGDGFESYRVVDWMRDLEGVADWLGSSSGRRRFLFMHTYETHDPYVKTDLITTDSGGRIGGYFDKRRWQELRGTLTDDEKRQVEALYDHGVAFADARLGELFEIFEREGVFDRSIVIVTSDHGEQFWEHGTWRHGMSLHDHQLLVPLIVSLPPELKRQLWGREELSGRVLEEQVRLVDLLPTVLDLVGVPIEHRIDGRSLRPLLEGSRLASVDAFAESLNVKSRESKALRSRRFKYIYSLPTEVGLRRGVGETRELFDLLRDPGESQNIAELHPEEVAELDARLQTLLELLDDPARLDSESQELDPDLERRLRALGYLGD